ncbi:MAG: DUF4440 domain-containing protein [Chitinophagales bacterium]|nr:DUF4440 domain-containing protein [Chitinophagales bacterium]
MVKKQTEGPLAIEQWAAAMNTHDVTHVIGLYSPHAILIPSMSSQMKKTAGQIKEYFAEFLAKPEFKVEIIDATTQMLEDITVESGIYIFSWTVKRKPHRVSARYTLVIQNDKIIQHHSSVAPQ